MKNMIRLALSLLVFVAQFATGGGLWMPSSVAVESTIARTDPSSRPSPRAIGTRDFGASIVAAFPVAEAQFAMPRERPERQDISGA